MSDIKNACRYCVWSSYVTHVTDVIDFTFLKVHVHRHLFPSVASVSSTVSKVAVEFEEGAVVEENAFVLVLDS